MLMIKPKVIWILKSIWGIKTLKTFKVDKLPPDYSPNDTSAFKNCLG